MGKIYNIVKIIVGVAALVMSFEYYFFWIQYHNYYYIGDIIGWFLFSVFMITEAFFSLVRKKPITS